MYGELYGCQPLDGAWCEGIGKLAMSCWWSWYIGWLTGYAEEAELFWKDCIWSCWCPVWGWSNMPSHEFGLWKMSVENVVCKSRYLCKYLSSCRSGAIVGRRNLMMLSRRLAETIVP